MNEDEINREEMAAATGRRLRLLRLAVHGINNQRAFCSLYGFHFQSWSAYENGRHQPKPDDALRLKRKFGITLDWLYGGSALGMPTYLMQQMHEIEEQEARGSKMPRVPRAAKSVAA